MDDHSPELLCFFPDSLPAPIREIAKIKQQATVSVPLVFVQQRRAGIRHRRGPARRRARPRFLRPVDRLRGGRERELQSLRARTRAPNETVVLGEPVQEAVEGVPGRLGRRNRARAGKNSRRREPSVGRVCPGHPNSGDTRRRAADGLVRTRHRATLKGAHSLPADAGNGPSGLLKNRRNDSRGRGAATRAEHSRPRPSTAIPP